MFEMQGRIFSINYYALHQKRFVDALEKNDFDKATSILENMFPAMSDSEKIDRTLILREGYEALSKKLMDEYENTVQKKCEELEKWRYRVQASISRLPE